MIRPRLRPQPRHWQVALLLLSCVVASGDAQEPQMGLRMDSRSAMQWRGDTLLVQSNVKSFSALPVGQIRDVWPGPSQGTFAVVSPAGVAMLLGTTVVPGGVVVERGELLRSSRPDVVWACVSLRGMARRRIVEVRGASLAREIMAFDVPVRDFDVDVSGRIAALLDDGRIVLAAGAQQRQEITAAASRSAVGGAEARRIFLDAGATQLALFAPGAVARLDVAKGSWSVTPFDASREALVRHAVSRRMRIEERW